MDQISLENAANLATSVLGSEAEQIKQGRNNWVFKKNKRILTIPRHPRVKGYAIRVAAAKKLEKNEIPVTKILDYSFSPQYNSEYLVVEEMEGMPANLAQLTSQERQTAHQEAGEILRRIHQISVDGYGRLDENLRGTSHSWKEFIKKFFNESLGRVKRSENLWEKYGLRLEETYNASQMYLETVESSSFLHADFHLGNLLFNNGRIVGVLDLDIVTGGDVFWDTGHYCHTFNVDRETGVKAFRRGYNFPIESSKERLYSLIIWTRKIGSQALDRPEALKETLPELEKILGEIK